MNGFRPPIPEREQLMDFDRGTLVQRETLKPCKILGWLGRVPTCDLRILSD